MAQNKKPPLEKTITRNIVRYLNGLPACYARKIHGGRYASGFPDIICVREGIAIWIEVKRPGGKPTKLQLVELENWRSAGALAIVAYSLDDVKKIMQ